MPMPRLFHRFMLAALVLVPTFVAGCGGKAPQYPVTGTVKFQGKALVGCKVILFPDVETVDAEKHGFGFGVTDAEGKFEVQHPQGEKGIRSGRYKVAFMYWVDSKGNPVPFDTKPSEVPGGVKSLLDKKYESPSSSPETIDVPKGGTSKDFNL